jgi:acyl transferase domain-containing protein
VAAVAKAYSKRKGILTIGSVKTNIGHTESVCGIASIQKTVLSMFHEMIPKHLHLNQISPDIDLSSIPAQLPLAPIPWKRGGKARLAGINSFGITGAQAHLILQEPPSVLPKFRIKEREERPLKIFTVSAKSADAFKAQLQRYQNLLKENQDFDMNDVEYTMHTGRAHFQLRNFVTGSSREELLASLEGGLQPVSVPNVTPKVCFLFTGQGSQYAGMAQSLYESSFVFR